MSSSPDVTLLERARRESNPLVEDGRALFVWEGERAPLLIGDFSSWIWGKPLEGTSVAPNLWTYELPLPDDAYMEYAFVTDRTSETRLPDPLNPRRVWNGINAHNHYFLMPDATPIDRYLRRPPKSQRGTLTRHVWQASGRAFIVGKRRPIWLYQPPVAQPVPLLVVFDGGDYVKREQIVPLLEHLMAAGQVRPLALALVENGRAARLTEYLASEATLAFVLEEVLPLASRHLTLIDPTQEAGVYGVLGASLGGLMALYCGLRAPHIFGHVIAQSGAYSMGRHEAVTSDLVRHLPKRDLRLWLDCGRYEWLLGANRAMVALLRERDYPLTYCEVNAGHNYTSWRTLLPDALAAVYGEGG
jgi:enterochelin esterase-like enzyme